MQNLFCIVSNSFVQNKKRKVSVSNSALFQVLSFNVLSFAGEKPLVECSFVTEFEDHIFVTVDAEAFFFLHDLITSYVKEKERVVSFFENDLISHNFTYY